jgi:phage gp45-like
MRRSSPRDTSDRLFLTTTRLTLDATDDSSLMQAMTLRGLHGEQMTTIEHAHPYGFTARPKQPTQESGGAGAMDGAPSPSQGKKQRAEAFVMFVNGNRSHGVATVVADRRFRPNNLQEGETVLHDDQKQQVFIGRDRIVVNTDKEVHVQRGDAHALLTDGKHKLQYGDVSVTMIGSKVWLGAEGKGAAVITENGPSKRIFAVVDEGDATMAAAQIAQRTMKGQTPTQPAPSVPAPAGDTTAPFTLNGGTF